MRKIEILFNHGQKLSLEIEDLVISMKGGIVTKLEWKESNPKVVFISVRDIIAITEIPQPHPDGGYG